jgi:hypothetical protein
LLLKSKKNLEKPLTSSTEIECVTLVVQFKVGLIGKWPLVDCGFVDKVLRSVIEKEENH